MSTIPDLRITKTEVRHYATEIRAWLRGIEANMRAGDVRKAAVAADCLLTDATELARGLADGNHVTD